VNDDPEVFFEEDDEESDVETGNAYDVFAPPGPIGIVVDTTQAGPIVHSLKKSSPMQGLINPGDLILALDDNDVRRMDAATLTKLMAKKSRQSERKFTLMSLEDYEP
jgi:C-terminal processing protease CtpA/Prc